MPLETQLAAAVEAYHRSRPLSGVLRLSGPDGVIFQRAFGYASQQLAVANQIDTKFPIASMTKMFIAAAVLLLVEKGTLDLQAHPGSYQAEFASLDPRIRLHHLLSNTSGLADVYQVPDLRLEAARLARDGKSLAAYLAGMAQVFAPGERWGYSSTGFLILAFIVQTVCARPFGAAMRELLLDPLDMPETGEDDPFAIVPGRAYGHRTRDGRDWNATNDKLAELDAPREFHSTVADLDRWCKAMLEGRILSPRAMAQSFTSYGTVDFDPNLGYGYGWFLGKSFRLIGGGMPGFRSELWQFPERQLNVIMLWNNEQVDSHHLFRQLRPLLQV